MTDIAPLGQPSVGQSAPIGPAIGRTRDSAHEVAARREADQVEVSPMARYLSQLREIDTFRGSLVDQIKSDIEQGRYETPERLDGAIEALIDEEPGLFEDAYDPFNEKA